MKSEIDIAAIKNAMSTGDDEHGSFQIGNVHSFRNGVKWRDEWILEKIKEVGVEETLKEISSTESP